MTSDAVQQVPLRHCPKPGLGGWEKVWADGLLLLATDQTGGLCG